MVVSLLTVLGQPHEWYLSKPCRYLLEIFKLLRDFLLLLSILHLLTALHIFVLQDLHYTLGKSMIFTVDIQDSINFIQLDLVRL